jgi:protein required for attachment to host cells
MSEKLSESDCDFDSVFAKEENHMPKNWLVVANNTGARIFTLAPPAPRLKDLQALQYTAENLPPSRLQERETLEHPEGRIKAQAIDADRPGRSFQSAGKKRHSMTRQVDPKTQQAITFARHVAERLESARRQGELERLILIAAPEFLGLLRENLGADLRRIIDQEFSLDLFAMTPQEIRAHLPERLFGGQEK